MDCPCITFILRIVEMADERILRLLEHDDFYEGESMNPVHRALKLKLATIKMAHASVCPGAFNRLDSSKPFSAEEERKFAILQLQANKYLQSRQKPLLPLLHLSMHMLLPFSQVSMPDHHEKEDALLKSTSNSPSKNLLEANILSLTSKSEKKKKANKKRSKLIAHNSNINNKPPEIVLEVEKKHEISNITEDHKTNRIDQPIYESTVSDTTSITTMQTEKVVQRHWNTLSIPMTDIVPMLSSIAHSEEQESQLFDLCSAYERYIMSMRETYELAIHAANLKTFIADNENERLKEELRKLQNQNLTGLPFR